MPVVINEFEVVAEAPPATPPGAAPPTGATEAGPSWTTHDIERIVCRQAERHARLRAD